MMPGAAPSAVHVAPDLEIKDRVRWFGRLREHLERMLALEVTLVVGGAFGLKLVGEPWQPALSLAAFSLALLGNWMAIMVYVGFERLAQKATLGVITFDELRSQWDRPGRPYADIGLAFHIFGSLFGVLFLAMYGLTVVKGVLFRW